jgi:hypothetical protein
MKDNRVFKTEPLTGHRPECSQHIPPPPVESSPGRFHWIESLTDRPARFFIQNGATAEFVRCDSSWTLNFNEALDFLSLERAVRWGRKELHTSFQVIRMRENQLRDSINIAVQPVLWPEVAGALTAHPGARLRLRRPASRAGATGSLAQPKALEKPAPAKGSGFDCPDGRLALETKQTVAQPA